MIWSKLLILKYCLWPNMDANTFRSNFSIKLTDLIDSDLNHQSGWDSNHCCLTFWAKLSKFSNWSKYVVVILQICFVFAKGQTTVIIASAWVKWVNQFYRKIGLQLDEPVLMRYPEKALEYGVTDVIKCFEGTYIYKDLFEMSLTRLFSFFCCMKLLSWTFFFKFSFSYIL